MGSILRSNSRFRARLGPDGYDFLEHAAGAVERILPHVEVSQWTEHPPAKSGAVWTSPERTSLRMTISIGIGKNGRSVQAFVQRRSVPVGQQEASHRILDLREQDICRRIAVHISLILVAPPKNLRINTTSLQAVLSAFDEMVVAEHLQQHHGLDASLREVFAALHKLAEQTYENKSLTFGCLFDRSQKKHSQVVFPRDFLGTKKYRALSDGYRTAYHLARAGQVAGFVDLEEFEDRDLTGKHYYPLWAEPMARASRDRKCGIALSRQGDVLVFDEGTLRFTYRYGRWQYWNHAHLVTLLRDRARAQHVKPSFLGRLIGEIYRAALDVSFRRSGALFVVLRNANNLRSIVHEGDAMGDAGRSDADIAFDTALWEAGVVARRVMVDLSSLDGAVVLSNSADVLAYGAVLRPKKSGRLRGSEGSRTKAAIGASFYGLSVKVSSDGDITVYHQGREFMHI